MGNHLSENNTFYTDRLKIRKPVIDDYHTLYTLYTSDPRVTKYTTWLPHTSKHQTKDFIKRCIDKWDNDVEYNAIVCLTHTGKPIGMVRVVLHPDKKATIGYVIAYRYWNEGYGTELLTGVIEYLFTHTDILEVSATCDTENKASEKVMQKAGMVFDTLIPKYVIHPSLSKEPRDVYKYTIQKK